MTDRREFLTASLTGIAASLIAAHEASATPTAKLIVQKDTPKVNLDGWQITASEVSYPTGESSAKHRHPGFVIGYVLEGQYRFAVNGEAEKVLKPGEIFFESFESSGDVHAVSGATAAGPAKILAIVFTKKGDPTSIPVPGA